MTEKPSHDERIANRGPVIIDVFEGEYSLNVCATVVFLHWVKNPRDPKQGVIAYATDEEGLTHQMLLEYAQDLGFMEKEEGVIGGGLLDCTRDFELIRGSHAFGEPEDYAVESLREHLQKIRKK